MNLKIRPHIAWQIVGHEVVLIDLEVGDALGLNPTAAFVWQRLESTTEDDLVVALAAEFDVEAQQARQDVRGFVDLLQRRGFVAKRV